MTTLQTAIPNALNALVPIAGSGSPIKGRVYPTTFPQQFTLPAIRYTFVSMVPIVDVCGDGDDVTAEIRAQLDVVHDTFVGVMSLRDQIMTVMKSFSPPAILENSSVEYDADTKVHRAILDYSFHGSS